jgi:hypothetical protein
MAQKWLRNGSETQLEIFRSYEFLVARRVTDFRFYSERERQSAWLFKLTKECELKRALQVEQPLNQNAANAADGKNMTLSTLKASRILSRSPEPSRRVRKRGTFRPRGSELVHCSEQAP